MSSCASRRGRVSVWRCACLVAIRHLDSSCDRGYRVCTRSQQRGAADEEDESKIRPVTRAVESVSSQLDPMWNHDYQTKH